MMEMAEASCVRGDRSSKDIVNASVYALLKEKWESPCIQKKPSEAEI